MNASDKDARRELGALYAALTVKSFSSGLTPAAQAAAIFPAEFATSEWAERADERIDAMFVNFQHRFGRSPGQPTISRVEELTQVFRSRLADVQSASSSTNFIALREAAETAVAAAKAAYGNGPKTAALQDEITKSIKPHLISLSILLSKKIFIGHGRSPLWREFKDFLQDNLKLPWEEFNRLPQAGVLTVERLIEMLESTSFAFLIMTGEDERGDGELHARENVIHEAGLFQGKLGFKRSIILLEDGCKNFSNIYGLGYIPFHKNKISDAFEEVRRTLQRENVI